MSALLLAVIATVAIVWGAVAITVAVVVGRAITLADRRSRSEALDERTPVSAHRA